MEELDYEKHLSYYRSLFGAESEFAEKKAQHHHALVVFNPLRDWFAKTVALSQQMTNKDARYYMCYGAGRRLNMIFHAYREIIFTASSEREQPLSHDEQLRLSRDINIIYMHLRGVLDNFAWCFLYEKEPGAVNSLSRMDIDLFSKKFRELPSFVKIEQDLSVHDDWNKEVKERRDPVAHRIPLYIPPAIVTAAEEAAQFNELNREYLEKLQKHAFGEAEMTFDQLSNIGRFYPCFEHHPAEGVIPIYPTIPTDIVHLIRIGDVIERSLVKGAPSTPPRTLAS